MAPTKQIMSRRVPQMMRAVLMMSSMNGMKPVSVLRQETYGRRGNFRPAHPE
jgi:hypothetical protein